MLVGVNGFCELPGFLVLTARSQLTTGTQKCEAYFLSMPISHSRWVGGGRGLAMRGKT